MVQLSIFLVASHLLLVQGLPIARTSEEHNEEPYEETGYPDSLTASFYFRPTPRQPFSPFNPISYPLTFPSGLTSSAVEYKKHGLPTSNLFSPPPHVTNADWWPAWIQQSHPARFIVNKESKSKNDDAKNHPDWDTFYDKEINNYQQNNGWDNSKAKKDTSLLDSRKTDAIDDDEDDGAKDSSEKVGAGKDTVNTESTATETEILHEDGETENAESEAEVTIDVEVESAVGNVNLEQNSDGESILADIGKGGIIAGDDYLNNPLTGITDENEKLDVLENEPSQVTENPEQSKIAENEPSQVISNLGQSEFLQIDHIIESSGQSELAQNEPSQVLENSEQAEITENEPNQEVENTEQPELVQNESSLVIENPRQSEIVLDEASQSIENAEQPEIAQNEPSQVIENPGQSEIAQNESSQIIENTDQADLVQNELSQIFENAEQSEIVQNDESQVIENPGQSEIAQNESSQIIENTDQADLVQNEPSQIFENAEQSEIVQNDPSQVIENPEQAEIVLDGPCQVDENLEQPETVPDESSQIIEHPEPSEPVLENYEMELKESEKFESTPTELIQENKVVDAITELYDTELVNNNVDTNPLPAGLEGDSLIESSEILHTVEPVTEYLPSESVVDASVIIDTENSQNANSEIFYDKNPVDLIKTENYESVDISIPENDAVYPSNNDEDSVKEEHDNNTTIEPISDSEKEVSKTENIFEVNTESTMNSDFLESEYSQGNNAHEPIDHFDIEESRHDDLPENEPIGASGFEDSDHFHDVENEHYSPINANLQENEQINHLYVEDSNQFHDADTNLHGNEPIDNLDFEETEHHHDPDSSSAEVEVFKNTYAVLDTAIENPNFPTSRGLDLIVSIAENEGSTTEIVDPVERPVEPQDITLEVESSFKIDEQDHDYTEYADHSENHDQDYHEQNDEDKGKEIHEDEATILDVLPLSPKPDESFEGDNTENDEESSEESEQQTQENEEDVKMAEDESLKKRHTTPRVVELKTLNTKENIQIATTEGNEMFPELIAELTEVSTLGNGMIKENRELKITEDIQENESSITTEIVLLNDAKAEEVADGSGNNNEEKIKNGEKEIKSYLSSENIKPRNGQEDILKNQQKQTLTTEESVTTFAQKREDVENGENGKSGESVENISGKASVEPTVSSVTPVIDENGKTPAELTPEVIEVRDGETTVNEEKQITPGD